MQSASLIFKKRFSLRKSLHVKTWYWKVCRSQKLLNWLSHCHITRTWSPSEWKISDAVQKRRRLLVRPEVCQSGDFQVFHGVCFFLDALNIGSRMLAQALARSGIEKLELHAGDAETDCSMAEVAFACSSDMRIWSLFFHVALSDVHPEWKFVDVEAMLLQPGNWRSFEDQHDPDTCRPLQQPDWDRGTEGRTAKPRFGSALGHAFSKKCFRRRWKFSRALDLVVRFVRFRPLAPHFCWVKHSPVAEQALVEALKINKAVTHINLSNNNLGPEVAKASRSPLPWWLVCHVFSFVLCFVWEEAKMQNFALPTSGAFATSKDFRGSIVDPQPAKGRRSSGCTRDWPQKTFAFVSNQVGVYIPTFFASVQASLTQIFFPFRPSVYQTVRCLQRFWMLMPLWCASNCRPISLALMGQRPNDCAAIFPAAWFVGNKALLKNIFHGLVPPAYLATALFQFQSKCQKHCVFYQLTGAEVRSIFLFHAL